MRTRVRSRRRRQNPLRRRSDVVETWTALAVAVLLFFGAPLVGAAAGLWAHDQARTIATTERADRHRVHATVIGSPARRPPLGRGQPPARFPGRGALDGTGKGTPHRHGRGPDGHGTR